MRIDTNHMMTAYAMSASSNLNNDGAADFAAEMCDEPVDDMIKSGNELEPGESRDYNGILESQMALGLHKRDMFLAVNAADEISEQVFNDHQRNVTRAQVNLHWAYL